MEEEEEKEGERDGGRGGEEMTFYHTLFDAHVRSAQAVHGQSPHERPCYGLL